MGLNLRDQRHVAHAQHTLAQAMLDEVVAGVSEGTSEIQILLQESRGTLVALGDTRGVRMVDQTAQRLREVVRSSEEAERDASLRGTEVETEAVVDVEVEEHDR